VSKLQLLVVSLSLTLAPVAGADTVWTTAGRLEGKVTFAKDQVAIDGKQVPWTEVVCLTLERGRSPLPPLQVVRLRNGEVWVAELLGLAEKKLEVRSELFGKHAIGLEQVAVLELVPQAVPRVGLKPGTLYRDRSEPVPGTLLKIDREKLSLDSPLGVLNLPLEGLTCYVVENPAARPPEREADEVTMTEGSILRGRLVPAADGLVLEHPLLGRLTLASDAVRSVARHDRRVAHLAEMSPLAVQTAPLLGPEVVVARMQMLRGNGTSRFVQGVQLEPRTVVRYSLPKRPGQKLRALLQGVEAARGDVRLKLSVGGKAIFDQEWKAGDAPRELTLELPEGDELVVEVDFGTRLRFPCGVVLGDLHLLTEKP
jgi:hypothetical protein